jgi:hypothetical protein
MGASATRTLCSLLNAASQGVSGLLTFVVSLRFRVHLLGTGYWVLGTLGDYHINKKQYEAMEKSKP